MEDPKTQTGQDQAQPRRNENEDRNNPQRTGNQNESTRSGQQGQSAQPKKPGEKGYDEGKVGQDTDGDGKVVQPGQKPGQSHGEGMPGKK